MYNSALKFYAKALLGKKNDMWYFDKLERAYPRKFYKEVEQVIAWADSEIGIRHDNTFYEENGYLINPVYSHAKELRETILSRYKDYFSNESLSFFLHLPPEMVSIGGRSWMLNFGSAMEFMGIEVNYFWSQFPAEHLTEKNIILSIGAETFMKNLDWTLLNQLKKHHDVKIGLQCSTDITNKELLNKYISSYLLYSVDFFYSFHSKDFVEESELLNLSKKKGFNIYSIEFSANPLVHFPEQYVKCDFDFAFLGSGNYDKINRYCNYFYEPFRQFKGLVAGPGWKWTPDFKMIPKRDGLLYSCCKVAINLHIDFQIINSNEINERSYQLAAYGIPQVIDNPKILTKKFDRIGLIANTPDEYLHQIRRAIANKQEADAGSKSALMEVYHRHTTFHRVESFIEKFKTDY